MPALRCIIYSSQGTGAMCTSSALPRIQRIANAVSAVVGACRQWVEEHQIDPALRALLPKDEGKPIERPAEAALRTRMADLLQRIHAHQVLPLDTYLPGFSQHCLDPSNCAPRVASALACGTPHLLCHSSPACQALVRCSGQSWMAWGCVGHQVAWVACWSPGTGS